MDEFQNFLSNLDPDEDQDEKVFEYLTEHALDRDLIMYTPQNKTLGTWLFYNNTFYPYQLIKSSAAAFFMRIAWMAIEWDTQDDLGFEIEIDMNPFMNYRDYQIEMHNRNQVTMTNFFEELVPETLRTRIDEKGNKDRLYALFTERDPYVQPNDSANETDTDGRLFNWAKQ
tara:strand:- start:35 stop:547 length:513 start_codon:yes stop_codon:yes gene_type:complete